MKISHYKLLIHAIMLLMSAGAFIPADAAERYAPLPPGLDGSMMPFDFSACNQIPYLPDSLKPVHAVYVARHGSRYLSGPAKIAPVLDALSGGRNKGTLSDTGEAFLSLMEEVRSANEDNWGDLTPLGVSEERRLARRLFETLGALGADGAKVNAISSYVPRSVMTMYQFSNQLIRMNDKMSVETDEGLQFDSLVCCFRADPEYARFRKDGDWKETFDRYFNIYVSPEPARRLFTTTRMSDRELRELTFDMYEVLKANRAAALPAPTTRWMSVDEYHGCWLASNLQHYLRNSVTPLSSDAARATAPLLRRIISDADSEIAEGVPVVNAYFGHAETLLPLLSLIHIPGCYDFPANYDNLDSCWKIQNIAPLAANVLLLISQGPSGAYYAVIQLNGRTVKPMRGMPDIVRWEALRSYWTGLLEEIPGNQ